MNRQKKEKARIETSTHVNIHNDLHWLLQAFHTAIYNAVGVSGFRCRYNNGYTC